MRTLFLTLMVTLLPLRGWVGDVMAMELLAPALAGSSAHVQSVHADAGECEHAAVGHVQASAAAHHAAAHGDTAGDAKTTDCASCTVCQICHSVALAAETPLAARPTQAAPMPASPPALYASAERAPGFKPPIS